MDKGPKEHPAGLLVVAVIGAGLLLILVIAVACAVFLVSVSGSYFQEEIKPFEVGVQTQGGTIKAIVGPGIYSDIGWDVGIERISCEAIPFVVEDSSIVTRDHQLITITIGGDFFRSCDEEFIEETWRHYQQIFLDDRALLNRVQDSATQAIKSCVDDYDADAILESGHAGIESCISDTFNALASIYGSRAENVRIRRVASASQPGTSD